MGRCHSRNLQPTRRKRTRTAFQKLIIYSALAAIAALPHGSAAKADAVFLQSTPIGPYTDFSEIYVKYDNGDTDQNSRQPTGTQLSSPGVYAPKAIDPANPGALYATQTLTLTAAGASCQASGAGGSNYDSEGAFLLFTATDRTTQYAITGSFNGTSPPGQLVQADVFLLDLTTNTSAFVYDYYLDNGGSIAFTNLSAVPYQIFPIVTGSISGTLTYGDVYAFEFDSQAGGTGSSNTSSDSITFTDTGPHLPEPIAELPLFGALALIGVRRRRQHQIQQ